MLDYTLKFVKIFNELEEGDGYYKLYFNEGCVVTNFICAMFSGMGLFMHIEGLSVLAMFSLVNSLLTSLFLVSILLAGGKKQ